MEVFRSIQGEGPHAGRPMVFVRTAVCPIRCLYCDSEHTFRPGATFSVHAPGVPPRTEANPCTPSRCAGLVKELVHGPAMPVSITGGEPLVWPGFVGELASLLGSMGFPVHLETAALDPEALEKVLGGIAHLSADLKLPSTLEQGDPRAANLACIRAAVDQGVETAVKVVVTPGVTDTEWASALASLADLRHGLRLVLQPVTPMRKVCLPASPATVLRMAEQARTAGFEVLVLPQVHRLLDLP